LWSETQTGVTVGNGYFSTLLGSVTPLSASDFDAMTRYLQVNVDTRSGFVDMPRQRLASAPYALQAEEAKHAASADSAATAITADSATTASSADSAPWSGLTGVPAGFADDTDDDVLGGLSCGDGQVVKWSDTAGEWACGDDNSGGGYENVIVVAKSGGDYSPVADALDSIASPAADNRYLVWVAPGVYTETQLAQVQGYVHLQGAGPNATLIQSSRSGGAPEPDAATVQLDDNGRISDVSIVNQGAGAFGIAIYSAVATRAALVDNVLAEVNGAGGAGHYAAYLNDMVNASPDVRDSYVCGGHRGIFVRAAGVVIDTSMWLSGIFWHGIPQRILEAWKSGAFEIVVSKETLAKLERKLAAKVVEFGAETGIVREWVALIGEAAMLVEPQERIRACRDADDDKFLEAAVAGQAAFIISSDKDLIAIGQFRDIGIVTPRQFLMHLLRTL